MIYISAQPDDYYFLWQLQLQLFNFQQIGISATSIHVLIGYSERKGLHPEFKKFIDTSCDAQFYIYPDRRVDSSYSASIVQYLIGQHFIQHSFLEEEIIFLHDSDMIFRERPNIDVLLEDEKWYASYTGS